MVDVLCHMREKALNEVNPHLMTIATLTGHAVVAMGNYTAIIDNGPARKVGFSRAIFDTGEACGDQVHSCQTVPIIDHPRSCQIAGILFQSCAN